ncbi:MAG: ATP-binding cassette domain-containing protein, partial [Acinetobacter calcoaceticus]
VTEASNFFEDHNLQQQFNSLVSLGLDYIAIGQRLNTFSGGERQRLKLTKQLNETDNIFVLDEPSTGLHPSDTEKLIGLLNNLVEKGNTIIVIEHNLDIISQADWIIDIGPLAGDKGGELVFSGTVGNLLSAEKSLTGQYLKKYLEL